MPLNQCLITGCLPRRMQRDLLSMPPALTKITSGAASGSVVSGDPHRRNTGSHAHAARANVLEDRRFTFRLERRALEDDDCRKRTPGLRSASIAMASTGGNVPGREPLW
jgi:hypothetical protein